VSPAMVNKENGEGDSSTSTGDGATESQQPTESINSMEDFVKHLYKMFSQFDDDCDDALTKDQLMQLIASFSEMPFYAILRDG